MVLVPCNHVETESIRDVQKLAQNLHPDLVSVELCSERLAPVKEELAQIERLLQNPRKFLQKDLATQLSKKGIQMEGQEAIAAILEAMRHKIPYELVDRAQSITRARFMAALPGGLWPLVWLPRLTRLCALFRRLNQIRFVRSGKGFRPFVPTSLILQQSLGNWPQPREVRERLLAGSRLVNGEQVLDLNFIQTTCRQYEAERRRFSLRSHRESLAHVVRQSPKPTLTTECPGPESLQDVFQRVIVDERDRIMSHQLRAEAAKPPRALILAHMGEAHVPGVRYYLKRPSQSDAQIQELMKKPSVPLLKELILPYRRVSLTAGGFVVSHGSGLALAAASAKLLQTIQEVQQYSISVPVATRNASHFYVLWFAWACLKKFSANSLLTSEGAFSLTAETIGG